MNKKAEFKKLMGEIKREAAIKECHVVDENNECEGNIVNAHSIQRGKILTSIAKNGEVYTLSYDYNELERFSTTFVKEGIKKFSTFSGFCQKHDKEIFQPIEDREFIGTPEQMQIYAYRAFIRDLHTKKVARNINRIAIKNDDWLKDLLKDIVDLRNISEFCYSGLIKSHFSGFKHYCISLDKFYPVVCNSTFIPYQDHMGSPVFSKYEYNEIQNFASNPIYIPFITLNVFPENGKTYVLISCLKTRESSFQFVNDMLKQNEDKLLLSISTMILTNCENIAFNPDYINEKFSKEEILKIGDFFKHTMANRHQAHVNDINLFR